ncbi:MAG: hypothetical protein HYY24_14975 [Verrucomicrobia bacterium]|nr:hypothetical protein [Verrucomicrobiota bacterium]
MEKQAAIEQIKKACNAVSGELMKIHPAVPALQDKETQDEIYKAIFELTKQVETIKKRLLRLQARDESTAL